MASEPFTPAEKKIFLASQPELTKAQFDSIADFIQSNVGIKMPEQKLVMVQSRLSQRKKP